MIIRTCLLSTGLLALAGPALGQMAPPSRSSIAASAVSESAPERWICASRTTIEIAPVSFDTAGHAEAWVMVHRIEGEVIAAERITKRDAERLRNIRCSNQNSAGLVG